MNTGVYKITNKMNGKIYIGSTCDSFEKRWKSHKKFLRLGCHRNIFLQRAWDKYGEKAFEFSVIEYVRKKEDIIKREQSWIDKYYDNGKNCYNISPTAGSNFGTKRSTETKELKSKQTKKLWEDPKYRENFIKKITGKKVKRKPFTDEHKKNLSAAGKKYAQTEQGKSQFQNMRAKEHPGVVSPDGKVYKRIYNLKEFCIEHGLYVQCLWNVCYGKSKHHKGWTKYNP